MMRLPVLALVILAWLLSCRHTGEEQARAETIINAMTPGRLQAFRYWSFSPQGNYWYYDSAGTARSATRLEARNDSLTLTVSRPQFFIEHFGLSVPADPRLYRLTLIKAQDFCLFVSEDSIIGAYRWTTVDCASDTAFKRGNPFTFFADLGQFKDSFEVTTIRQGGAEGNFTEFYLPEGYVLTYLPEPLALPPAHKKEWEEKFKRGEMIRPDWNLRKNKETDSPD